MQINLNVKIIHDDAFEKESAATHNENTSQNDTRESFFLVMKVGWQTHFLLCDRHICHFNDF